jgi:hypothetical protein
MSYYPGQLRAQARLALYNQDKIAGMEAVLGRAQPLAGRAFTGIRGGASRLGEKIMGTVANYERVLGRVPGMVSEIGKSPGSAALTVGAPAAGMAGLNLAVSNIGGPEAVDKELYGKVKDQAQDLLGFWGVRNKRDYNNANWDHSTNKITIGGDFKDNPYILAHELGHARNVRATGDGIWNKAQRVLQTYGYPAGRLATSLTAPITIARAVGSKNPSRIFKQAPLLGAALFSPVLLEEAMASARAASILKEADPDYSRWQALKQLGSAYSTYAVSPMLVTPLAMAGLAAHPRGRKIVNWALRGVKNVR